MKIVYTYTVTIEHDISLDENESSTVEELIEEQTDYVTANPSSLLEWGLDGEISNLKITAKD